MKNECNNHFYNLALLTKLMSAHKFACTNMDLLQLSRVAHSITCRLHSVKCFYWCYVEQLAFSLHSSKCQFCTALKCNWIEWSKWPNWYFSIIVHCSAHNSLQNHFFVKFAMKFMERTQLNVWIALNFMMSVQVWAKNLQVSQWNTAHDFKIRISQFPFSLRHSQ